MKYTFPLAAVIALVLIAWLGSNIPGMQYFLMPTSGLIDGNILRSELEARSVGAIFGRAVHKGKDFFCSGHGAKKLIAHVVGNEFSIDKSFAGKFIHLHHYTGDNAGMGCLDLEPPITAIIEYPFAVNLP